MALAAIAALPLNILLTGDLPRLRTELLETYRLRPLLLDWDARAAEARAAEAQDGTAPARTIVVFVPFSGTRGLFDMTPTRRGGEVPTGSVRDAELVLLIEPGQADVGLELQRRIALITDCVAQTNAHVGRFNRELSATLRTRLASLARRARRDADLALELGPPPRQPNVVRQDHRRPTRSSTGNGGGHGAMPMRRGPGRPDITSCREVDDQSDSRGETGVRLSGR